MFINHSLAVAQMATGELPTLLLSPTASVFVAARDNRYPTAGEFSFWLTAYISVRATYLAILST